MRIQLQEVCVKASSNIAQKDLENHIGEYPIYGASGFIKTVDFYKHEKPYVAVVKDGAGVGRTMLLPEKSSVIGTMQALIPNEKIAPELLKYVVQNMHLENSYTGATIPHIYFKDYCKKEFDLPDKKQQVQIITILSTIEEIIENYHKELKLLDLLIKSRFVEMFGDPIRNTKSLKTKELKDVMILKAGDFTAASDISAIPSGDNIYPCYGGNGIRGYVAQFNQEGDYSLIGRQGALSGNVQYAKGKFRNTEHALLVTPICEMNSVWLNQLLIILDLKRYQTGAAQPGLSVKNLQEIPIIIVSLDEQEKYASFIERVDKSKLAQVMYRL